MGLDHALSKIVTNTKTNEIQTISVCDWRKANHIHAWFINHLKDGVDDQEDVKAKPKDLKAFITDYRYS